MAIILRAKQTIHGLNADLATLQNVDAAEETARIAGDAALRTDLNTETNTRISEISRVESEAASNTTAAADAVQANVDALEATVGTNKTDAATATTLVQTNLDTEIASTNTDIVALNARVDYVVNNTDSAALDSLTEVVEAFQSADSDMNAAISTLASDRESALAAHEAAQATINTAHDATDVALDTRISTEVATLNVTISDEVTARIAAVALTLKKASNLSDLADTATARNNLGVNSTAETAELVRVGGPKFKTETLIVTADKVTTSEAPKDGVILNYSTVRNIDGDGVASDIPVSMIAGNPQGFDLHPDIAGQFDGQTVTVQFAYVPVA